MWSMDAEEPIKEGDKQFMDKRLTLMEFIRQRRVDIKFSLSAGTQLQGENFNRHMQQFFEVSPDPSVKRYTEKVGIHNLIKMSRFLDLLGPQTTQITMRSDGKPLVSWVIKTTKNKVEHIQVIPGKMDGATIDFDAELNDFKINGQQRSSRLNNIRLVAKLLASNKGIKRQLGLCRLITAAGIEFTMYLGTKNNGNSE